MARPIHLNGSPGVGKSTVARRWAAAGAHDYHHLVLVAPADELARRALAAGDADALLVETVAGDVEATYAAVRAAVARVTFCGPRP